MLLAMASVLFANSPTTAHAQNGPLENLDITDPSGLTGKLSISSLNLGPDGLLASGTLQGVLNGTQVTQAFTNVPVVLASAADPLACDVLFLDLGPIFLDVLGLQVDLSQIVLDIDAVAGAGNLVGNLLCAIVGLLDGFSLDALLAGILAALLNTLNGLL
jgi:hypothetical protein